MRKYVAELIGTFFFVLTFGCTVVNGAAGVIAPLAIGAAFMVMVYATGHISGGHLNPAVTLGAWLRRRLAGRDAAYYWIAQLLGAILAAVTTRALRGAPGMPVMPMVWPAFAAEFLFTFALVFVALSVTGTKGTASGPFHGLAIGMTVMVGAFSVGNISAAALNPAVAVGVVLMGLISWSRLWIYLAAELLGGAAAAAVFRALNPEDK